MFSRSLHLSKVFYNWSNGASFTHGGSGGSKRVIGFAAGEFITGIEGYSTAEGINQLTIVTTLRTFSGP